MTGQEPVRVAIIGAGPGGLVLTHMLRQDSRFHVTVYERGPRGGSGSGTSLLVGFRILVPPSVLDDLRHQLPTPVAALLDDAIGVSQSPGNRVALMNEQSDLICRLDLQQSRDMCSISRWKFREALLHDAESGITVIYFKVPFTPETEAMIPWKSGCLAMTPRPSMAVTYYKDRQKPYGPYDLENIDPNDSFLMFGLGSYTNEFENQSKHPDEMISMELKDECLSRAKNWNPLLRALISLSVPSSVFMSHVKTQDPIKPWESGRVTLLGDAAHSMTLYLGKGASSAIMDAMSLGRVLKSEPRDGRSGFPTGQLSAYEKEMLKDGFRAATHSMTAQRFLFNAGDTPWKFWWRNLVLKAWDWWMMHPSEPTTVRWKRNAWALNQVYQSRKQYHKP
ncbi:hypothetical protein FGADI_12780 [Fusarium gaditjirri]|uniref:FAD-binding domain-containing protein n=1 Tax=Fusarium gaditjirri TaxID=282569 RepID=A0A8H4WNK7_9HYPO|nr:hypothetical protein FGADI_12780 [Fusarium gaditjirri]